MMKLPKELDLEFTTPMTLFSLINNSEVIAVYTAVKGDPEGMPNTERLLFTRERLDDGAERISVFVRDLHSDNWLWRLSSVLHGRSTGDDEVINRLTEELYGSRLDNVLFVLAE